MSSDYSNPQLAAKDDDTKDNEKAALEREDSIQGPSIGEGIDILGKQALDTSLNAKMHIVNNVRNTPTSAPPCPKLEISKRDQAHPLVPQRASARV